MLDAFQVALMAWTLWPNTTAQEYLPPKLGGGGGGGGGGKKQAPEPTVSLLTLSPSCSFESFMKLLKHCGRIQLHRNTSPRRKVVVAAAVAAGNKHQSLQ